MLEAETRALLDLMDAAVKGGRPRLETLPHAVGRKAVDKMSEDGEAEPPEVAEVADGGFAGPASEIAGRLVAATRAIAAVERRRTRMV